MKKYLLIASTVLLFACQSQTKPQGNGTDTILEPVNKEVPSTKTESANINLKSKILGAWTNGVGPNATFLIEKDSVLFEEGLEWYKYNLKSDSMKIFFEDYQSSYKLSFIKDTLVMTSPEDGTSKFWKFKD